VIAHAPRPLHELQHLAPLPRRLARVGRTVADAECGVALHRAIAHRGHLLPERRRALLAVAAGESIGPEAMRDLVGVGFVHVTTSRRVVTEKAMAWLESLGDGGTVGRTGDAVADAVNGAATSGTDVTAGETATASAFVSDYPDIPEFLRRTPAVKPLSAP
jgi:hypothetical protein